jgi:hypothetical protein
MVRLAAFLCLLCCAYLPLSAQTVSLEQADIVPRVTNGTLNQRPLSGPLSAAMEQIGRSAAGPVWAGYAIPAALLKPNLFSHSGDSFDRCSLENRGYRNFDSSRDLLIFIRFERSRITRLRSFPSDCTIDAAGTSVEWLSPVAPAESVAWLLSLALRDDARSFSAAAIAAIAFHSDPSADAALEQLVSAGQARPLREQAAFWMASEGTARSVDILLKLAREDTDEAFRRSLTFPLSIAGDAGVQELIRMVHSDSSPRVRGQALFWMAQKAGVKVAAEIATALENDPDTEVKKRAVFALAQIPNGEGIPKLIEVARTNRNGAVRKQAVFWLGQSHDQRAVSFIEDILTH